MEPLSGHLLIAGTSLLDPNFRRAVVLIGHHDDDGAVGVVLNRANSKVGMKPGEVEGALEVKVRFELPSDGKVPLAVNRGTPLVLADDKADYSRAMREMAKGLSPAEAAKVQKRRLFSRA